MASSLVECFLQALSWQHGCMECRVDEGEEGLVLIGLVLLIGFIRMWFLLKDGSVSYLPSRVAQYL